MIRREVGPARIWFTDRRGGTSSAPYDGNNLADHVGDDPTHVRENRHRLAALLAAEEKAVPADPGKWVWLRQVHERGGRRRGTARRPPVEADASVTAVAGRPLVVLTADCAPIALATDGALAVVHAGWSGIEAGVIEGAVQALRAAGTGPVRADARTVHPSRRGTSSGPTSSRDSPTVSAAEVASHTADGAPALDVPVAVRRSLDLVGVDVLDDVDVCTAASPDHFSYRRDGTTGRQAVVAVLT